jgi:hypothetical protein
MIEEPVDGHIGDRDQPRELDAVAFGQFSLVGLFQRNL